MRATILTTVPGAADELAPLIMALVDDLKLKCCNPEMINEQP